MNFYCIICFKINFNKNINICKSCMGQLVFAQKNHSNFYKIELNKEKIDLYSVFLYNHFIRQIIIRIKAGSDIPMLNFFKNYVIKNSNLTEIIDWSDVIIPAHSSIWSRIRGNLDLAEILTKVISKKFNKKIEYLPFKMYWKFKKYSKISRSKRMEEKINNKLEKKYSSKDNLLIIDDIITTGQTFKQILKWVDVKNVKLLTLAYAYKN